MASCSLFSVCCNQYTMASPCEHRFCDRRALCKHVPHHVPHSLLPSGRQPAGKGQTRRLTINAACVCAFLQTADQTLNKRDKRGGGGGAPATWHAFCIQFSLQHKNSMGFEDLKEEERTPRSISCNATSVHFGAIRNRAAAETPD